MTKDRDAIMERVKAKESRVEEEFRVKKNTLKASFNENLHKLVKNIASQREIVSASYGSLTLQNKQMQKPIFEINPDIDAEGAAHMANLEKYQQKVPQILNVRVKQLRCLKDKVSPGYFVVKVTALNRLGGVEVCERDARLNKEYRALAEDLRDYHKKKRQFLDKENRETDVQQEDGTTVTKAALATGIAFFKAKEAVKAGRGVNDIKDDIENERPVSAESSELGDFDEDVH